MLLKDIQDLLILYKINKPYKASLKMGILYLILDVRLKWKAIKNMQEN